MIGSMSLLRVQMLLLREPDPTPEGVRVDFARSIVSRRLSEMKRDLTAPLVAYLGVRTNSLWTFLPPFLYCRPVQIASSTARVLFRLKPTPSAMMNGRY